MKKIVHFCLQVVCCAFFVAMVFSTNYAKAQENSSSVPQVYTTGQTDTADQNGKDLRMGFGSITAVGNTLYVNANKVWFPIPEKPADDPYQPMESQSQRVIRAIDFSNPENPVLINDINMDVSDSMCEIAISGGYFYLFRGENDLGPYPAGSDPLGNPYGNPPPKDANLSILKIQDNEQLIKAQDITLTNILDVVRKDKNEMLQAEKLIVTDKYAYLVFDGISLPDPQSAAPSSFSPPENNTVIVTIDITDPSHAEVLGATRLQIASTGGNMDLVVSGTTGYLIAPSVDGKDSNINVLDLSSPDNIVVTNSLTIYGEGGQLVKQGDKLYVAAQNVGLEIVDISDPQALKLLGWIETRHPFSGMMMVSMGGYRNLIVKGNYAYLLDREEGLFVLDVSDSISPRLVASYNSKYASISSMGVSPYAPYMSMYNCGDYLFLGTAANVEVISVVNPLSPVLVGLLGEREPMAIDITLKLEAAELLNFHTEKIGEDTIALFGISSLDALNRKYGVSKIVEPDKYMTNYWTSQVLPQYNNYTVEDIKNDRRLRRFYITFPASADIKAIVAEYQKNPYVIVAGEVDMDEVVRQANERLNQSMSYGSYGSSTGELPAGYSGFVKDTTPPENVTDFSATAGDKTITLSWTPSIDTAKDLFAQLLYIDSGNGYEAPVYLDKDAKTYEITAGITNGKSYTVKLTTIDSQHNESDGVTATVTPLSPMRAQTLLPFFWNSDTLPVIQIVPAIIQIGSFGFGAHGGNGGNDLNNAWNTGLFGIGCGPGFGRSWDENWTTGWSW
jgi:hypothetical protein